MNDTNEVLAFHADIAVGLSPYAESLIEHIKALQSRLESLEQIRGDLCRALNEAGDSLIECADKIESLEKDAARYRWMRSGKRAFGEFDSLGLDRTCEEEFDSTIDAAMKG